MVAHPGMFSAPQVAPSAPKVQAVTQAINCFMDENDDKPSYFELPLQPAIGGGMLKFYAGGILCGSSILCVAFGALTVLRRGVQNQWTKRSAALVLQVSSTTSTNGDAITTMEHVLFVVSSFCAVGLLYLTPNIMGAAVLLFVHGDSTERVVAAVSIVMLGVCVAFVLSHLTCQYSAKIASAAASMTTTTSKTSSQDSISDGDDEEDETAEDEETTTQEKATSGSTKQEFTDAETGSFFVLTFQTLFDGTADHMSLPRRLYAMEELLSASTMAALAGMRPGADHCSKITSGILVVSLAHASYVVLLAPLRTRLDHCFSVFFAVVQVVMGVSCVAATRIIETDGESEADTALTVVSATVLVMFAGFFVQVFVQAYWAYHVFSRKKIRSDGQVDRASSDSDDDDNNSPPDDDTMGKRNGIERRDKNKKKNQSFNMVTTMVPAMK